MGKTYQREKWVGLFDGLRYHPEMGQSKTAIRRARWQARRLWVKTFGPLPRDMHVHHKDEDPFNNALDNLELLPGDEHNRRHTKQNWQAGLMKPPTQEALVKAAEWHRSEAGLAWHKQHGPKTWDNRAWYSMTCEVCHDLYASPFPTRSKFCHLNCKMTALRRRRKQV